jgi:hypothetical protein
MAKKRTEKSRFQSRYGGGWVSNAQYMTECLCVLIAKSEKRELFEQFWNEEPWTSIFRRQVPIAIKLLEKHPPEVVLAALRDRRCWKIHSFGANWLLKPLLVQKQREYDAQIAQQSDTPITTKVSTVQKPRNLSRKKKSLFSQLKEV